MTEQELILVAVLVVVRLVLGPRKSGPSNDWVRADLSKVPYVIPRPEAHGPMLPWYRRVFRGGDAREPEPSPPQTYR